MINLSSYKYLIFDLGGVLLNIDYALTSKAFVALGVSNFDDLYTQASQSDLFNLFEKGEISPKEFRSAVRKITNLSLKDQEIDKAWNCMLLDFPIHRMELLENLAKRHPLILMSNTNEIHVEAFTKIIDKSFGMKRFESVFERLYYSSSIGMRKPHKETFEWILSVNGLDKSDCWFVDDSQQHIRGAKLAGIDSHLLESNQDISQIFSS